MSLERQPSLLQQKPTDTTFSFLSTRLSPRPDGPEQQRIPNASVSAATDTSSSANDKSKTPSNGSSNSNSSSSIKEINLVALATELALSIGLALVSSMILGVLIRRFSKGLLPESSSDRPATSEKQVYSRLHRIRQKLGHAGRLPTLSTHEILMAEEILDPEDIDSSFSDIGGLDHVKQEIYELAVLPLVQSDLFSSYKSKLVQPVKGILLYGKPGTGKTMLAKSLAKEAEAVFLPLQLSKILNKYWGESNKLIAATFSLAHKLQPAVIFIDELDTFLKNSNSETAYMDSIKAEFLTLWDGVATAGASRVLVLGATNKPQHIDPAILRRMPRAFEVPLPNKAGRLSILELLVKDEHIDDTVVGALPKLAAATAGYSGSDLKELCRAAAMVPFQERTSEFARRRVMGENDAANLDDSQQIRQMSEKDLVVGLQKVRRTGMAAYQYGKSEEDEKDKDRGDGGSIDFNSLKDLAEIMRRLASTSTKVKDDPDDVPNL